MRIRKWAFHSFTLPWVGGSRLLERYGWTADARQGSFAKD